MIYYRVAVVFKTGVVESHVRTEWYDAKDIASGLSAASDVDFVGIYEHDYQIAVDHREVKCVQADYRVEVSD